MTLSPFSPSSYYRFSNANFPNTGISTGYKHENTPPHLGLTPYGSRSSENWQIYRQRTSSGRYIYFLRNYDYGAALQLGVTPEHRAVPRLLPRSGELGQQWSMDLGADGKWVLTNGLLGNASFLGVSGGGDRGEYTRDVPSMNPSPDGSEHWTVLINVSAGEIREREALCDVQGLEVRHISLHFCPVNWAILLLFLFLFLFLGCDLVGPVRREWDFRSCGMIVDSGIARWAVEGSPFPNRRTNAPP